MLKPAKKSSLRGRLALGMKSAGQRFAKAMEGSAMALAGVGGQRGGYEGGKRNSRRTSNWRSNEETSAATDELPDLPTLRARSRDLDRNHPLAHGALQTKATGVIGAGLQLRSVLDFDVLGIPLDQVQQLQYAIEREWEIFEREADFTGQQHLRDLQRMWFWSANASGDIGIARRWRKRPGETYGTRLVSIEADRIGNPRGVTDTATLQAGIQLSAEGEILGCHICDRHPGDFALGRSGTANWTYVPRRGATSGMLQFVLLQRDITRPGQVRGIPLFATVLETLKQLGNYTDAELKAAVNDAYLFAFETQPAEMDEEGQPIITRPDGEQDSAGELTLEDLTITTLPPGGGVQINKPSRPNQAFEGFVTSFCKYLGAALGLPYEVLMQHFGASFSASRGALEMAYKGFVVEQARFIRSALDVVREWQFTEMVASGRFDAPGFFDDPIMRAAWLGREWIGPTRIQINPKVEAEADKTDIELGTKTREQVMTERTGGSFDTKSKQVLRERAVLGVGAPVPAAAAPAKEDQSDDDEDDAK